MYRKSAEGEQLIGVIPNIDKKIKLGRKVTDYDEMKAKERMEIKQTKEEAAKGFLLDVIAYCNQNGKKSDFKLKENETVKDFFRILSDEKLYNVYELIKYAHDPICPECGKEFDEGVTECIRCDQKVQRFIVSIPAHQQMNYIIAILENMVIGLTEDLEIERIMKQLNSKVLSLEEKRVMSDRINVLRNHKEIKLAKQKVEKPKNEVFICEGCKKVCKTSGGLGSHQNHCDEYKKLQK